MRAFHQTYFFIILFQSNPCQHPIVILRDIDKDDMRGLLRFMYHGEVRIAEHRLKDFLRAAETLQVRGLADGEAEKGEAASAENDDDNNKEVNEADWQGDG